VGDGPGTPDHEVQGAALFMFCLCFHYILFMLPFDADAESVGTHVATE
jgi:hypothetical protein